MRTSESLALGRQPSDKITCISTSDQTSTDSFKQRVCKNSEITTIMGSVCPYQTGDRCLHVFLRGRIFKTKISCEFSHTLSTMLPVQTVNHTSIFQRVTNRGQFTTVTRLIEILLFGHRQGALHPASRASASSQNQLSPFLTLILVRR